MKINILGTEYEMLIRKRSEDRFLTECDGYCDKTSKLIVVAEKDEECELDSFSVYQKKCIRHEIIHAFLFESGLHENFEHSTGHDETYVDWMAAQFPKIVVAFRSAGCLD